MRVYSGSDRIAVIGESNFDEVNLQACARQLKKSFTVGKWGRGLYFTKEEAVEAYSAFTIIFGRKVGRYLLEKTGIQPN